MKLLIKDPFLLEHLREVPELLEDEGILRPMLAYVAENWESGNERNRSSIETILTAVLMRFFIGKLHYEDRDSTYILTERYNKLTREIFVWVEKNYLQKFSLDDLGGALNYNKNYLSSTFSENTGVSIMDYTNFLRVRKAVIFFAYYGSDVLTACEGAGFRNPSYFSRTFKALVGLPPRSFCRVFSVIPEQERTEYFRRESVLSYRPCTMEDAFRSLRHIGETAKKLQNDKNGTL
jgi:AraC-like DNA-binding protein